MPFTSSPASRQPGSVVKKLKPGTPGTLRWVERFGDKLMCVRYRVDATTGRRHTTVELLVEERAINRQAPAEQQRPVFLRVGAAEKDLQYQIKNAGGTWNPQARLWVLPYSKAKTLKLVSRIVKNVE